MSHRFTTQLEEDDYGDPILTIPYDVCEAMGWDIGTNLDDRGWTRIYTKENPR